MERSGPSTESWVDVQPLLSRAATQLRTGELLHADDFSLFAVMSAIEIGDPRLDAGMEQNRSAGPLQDADMEVELNGPQVLAIMDQLAVMEATWLSGSLLSQTVYTCHYLLRQERITHLTSLSAFCFGMKVTAKAISDLVFEAAVCEEEDFATNMFGYQHSKGLPDVPKFVSEVTLAEERLTALQRAAQSQTGRNESECATGGAVLARLRFRRHFLQALQKFRGRSKQDLEAARKQLILAGAELERVEESSYLCAEHAEGFDPHINRHLMGPAPPRAVRLLTKAATWASFSRLLSQLLTICDVTKISSWGELKQFMYDFAAMLPEAVARSVMAQTLAAIDSASPSSWAPDAAMIGAALGLPKTRDGFLCNEVNTFVEQCAVMANGWVRCKCMNRARQRRRHRRTVEDWVQLTRHAQNAEAAAQFKKWLTLSVWRWHPLQGSRLELQGPLSVWVEKECCQELLQHLLLGFELDCYLPYEYCMIYWYCDYLYGLAMEDADALAAACPYAGQSPRGTKDRPGNRKSPKGLSKGTHQDEKAISLGAQILSQEAKMAFMERQLCQGLMRCAAALQVAGLLSPRPAPFNSEEQYFEQRFFVFSQLTAPSPLMFEDYAAAMNLSDCTAVELLRSAAMNLHEVRRHATLVLQSPVQSALPASMVAKVQTLERVAKHNLVATALLTSTEASRQAEGNQPAPKKWLVDWDFSHHKFFPVISLRSAA